MSLTKEILKNGNLASSEYVAILNSYHKRADIPKPQKESIWDITDEENFFSENNAVQLSNSSSPVKVRDLISPVPSMFDVERADVGMFLNDQINIDSEESYSNVDEMFGNSDSSCDSNKKYQSVFSSSSNSVENLGMDIALQKESQCFLQDTCENSALTSGESLFKAETSSECASQLRFNNADSKRDLTTPEKVSTKRQCFDSVDPNSEKSDSNLNSKFKSVTHLSTNATNMLSEVNNKKCSKLDLIETKSSIENGRPITKKNFDQFEMVCNSSDLLTQPSKFENRIDTVDKKCSELKLLQQKASEHCQWRKKSSDKLLSPTEKPTNEFKYELKSLQPEASIHSEWKNSHVKHLTPPEEKTPRDFQRENNWNSFKSCEQISKVIEVKEVTNGLGKDECKSKSCHLAAHYKENEQIVNDKEYSTTNKECSKSNKDLTSNKCESVIENKENSVLCDSEKSMLKKAEKSSKSLPDNSAKKKSNVFRNEQNSEIRSVPMSETCSKSEIDDMVNLTVISRNRNSDLVVRKAQLEHIRSKSKEMSDFIPPIDEDEKTINYSIDATMVVLRFLFLSPYSVSSWKVALEVISMANLFNLPSLRDLCLQYLKTNFPHNDEDQVIEYIRHFKIMEDFIDFEVMNERNTISPVAADRPRVYQSTCSISSTLIVEPLEFCISLSSTKQYIGNMFEADIKNEVIFEATSGSFFIHGIQIKLKSGVSGSAKKKVLYSVSKRNKMLISDSKEKPFNSLMFLNFKKKIVVRQKESLKISIMIEDIPSHVCYTTPRLKLIEKLDKSNFKIMLSSNKNHDKFRKPLFFVEKLFYTLNN